MTSLLLSLFFLIHKLTILSIFNLTSEQEKKNYNFRKILMLLGCWLFELWSINYTFRKEPANSAHKKRIQCIHLLGYSYTHNSTQCYIYI